MTIFCCFKANLPHAASIGAATVWTEYHRRNGWPSRGGGGIAGRGLGWYGSMTALSPCHFQLLLLGGSELKLICPGPFSHRAIFPSIIPIFLKQQMHWSEAPAYDWSEAPTYDWSEAFTYNWSEVTPIIGNSPTACLRALPMNLKPKYMIRATISNPQQALDGNNPDSTVKWSLIISKSYLKLSKHDI